MNCCSYLTLEWHKSLTQDNTLSFFVMSLDGNSISDIISANPILMKRKELQWILGDLESFKNPKVLLEQYATGPEIAGNNVADDLVQSCIGTFQRQ